MASYVAIITVILSAFNAVTVTGTLPAETDNDHRQLAALAKPCLP